MIRLWLAFILLISSGAAAQSGDILGAHDMGNQMNTVRGSMSSACLYCHAPHSGAGKGPLWGQTLSSQTYTLYSSDTLQNAGAQPVLGKSSSLCLSCHDGTVAPGLMMPYGQLQITGTMSNLVGTQLENSHPFSLQLPLKDAASLVESLAATGQTTDPTGSVKLVEGNIECTTCHNPHNQAVDQRSKEFLVRDNAAGAICLACHTTAPRTVNTHSNPLEQWNAGIHATSGVQVNPAAGLGAYSTVAEFACQSCHVSHNAAGSVALLRNPNPPVANIDSTSQSCITCHAGGTNLSVPLADVFSDFRKRGHPFSAGTNLHSPSEKVQLDQNRHATCADCHNAHAAKQVVAFGAAPGIRASQTNVRGIGSDGANLTGAAVNQYENCLRCHGNSSGKESLAVYGYLPSRASFAGDQLNVIPQFAISALSSHPVMRDALGGSQPSLLANMWNLGGTVPGRQMGTRIFCTDCHNSDVNREFGGTGANGPHGSDNDHILERPYIASQVAPGAFPAGGPGSLIINLVMNPQTSPAVAGPYTLCAKCHNLDNILSDVSWSHHQRHVKQEGISCSVCHSAHGVPAGGIGAGSRLINFDVNVVAPNNGVIAYSGATCTLRCHMTDHNPDGSIVKVK
jgi:predicted CXXCH cytochrome family protein